MTCGLRSHLFFPLLVILKGLAAGSEKLTKRNDDRTGDAVGHDHSEDVHHPGICCPELELVRLILCSKSHIN